MVYTDNINLFQVLSIRSSAALDKLDFSMYKNPYLIDINPGCGVWSAAIHKRLKPRKHIVLEPDERLHDLVGQQLLPYRDNVHILPKNAYYFGTWDIFTPKKGEPVEPVYDVSGKIIPEFRDIQRLPHDAGIHPQILITGNIAYPGIEADRMVAQWLAAHPVGEWMMRYGRVRWLLWCQEKLAIRFKPTTLESRQRSSVVAQATSDIHQVVRSPSEEAEVYVKKRERKGDPRYIKDRWLTSQRAQLRELLDGNAAGDPKTVKRYQRRLNSEKARIRKHIENDEFCDGLDHPAWYYQNNWDVLDAELDVKLNEYRPPLRPFDSAYHSRTPEELRWQDHTPSEKYAEFSRVFLSVTDYMNRVYQINQDDDLSERILDASQPYEVLMCDTKKDIYPSLPIRLLDFQPKKVSDYFCHPDINVRKQRWNIYNWLMRSLFALRAKEIKQALVGVAPGAEFILDELPEDKKIDPRRTVRTLSALEFVDLAKAWDAWPFKEEGVEYTSIETSRVDEARYDDNWP